MTKKSANYNQTQIQQLPDDKPVVYRIQPESGRDNYVGTAQRGRVSDRIAEHFGDVPGAKVKIEQHSSIKDARESETRIIKRHQPKCSKKGK